MAGASRRLVAAAVCALAAAGCAGESEEGHPWIHEVKLEGVKHGSEKDLRSKISVEGASWFPLSRKPTLDPFALELDRKRIEAWYHARGYFNARVTVAEAEARDAHSVNVRFVVEEGPPTRIASIVLGGIEPLGGAASWVKRGFDLDVGQVFEHARFIAATDRIEQRMKALGHAWATVARLAVVNRDDRAARLSITAAPGPVVRIESLRLRGIPDRVSESQLLMHVGLHPGELATPTALDEARDRIYSLGVFSSVKPIYERDSTHPDRAVASFDLHPGSLNDLRIGGGFGLEALRNEVRLRALYQRRNFFGGLRSLRLDGQIGWVAVPAVWNIQRQGPAARIDAQIVQPDLLLPLDRARVTVGYDVGIDYAYQFHGPRGQLAWSWSTWRDHLQMALSYNAQFLLFFNTDPTILQNPAQARALFGFTSPYLLGWLQEDVALDFRDQPVDARKGFYFAASFEEGGPWAGGKFQYEKLTPEARGYLPLGSRVVIAARVRYGKMFSQGTLGTPITRRFYLGGPDTQRGFNYDRLSPQVPSSLAGVPPLPIGGDEELLGQIELRLSVFKFYGYWLETAAFLDAGDVSTPSCSLGPGGVNVCPAFPANTPSGIDVRDLNYATGAGLRYRTVLGTIRADVGIRLNRLGPIESNGRQNPDPGDRYVFHLSIGEPF